MTYLNQMANLMSSLLIEVQTCIVFYNNTEFFKLPLNAHNSLSVKHHCYHDNLTRVRVARRLSIMSFIIFLKLQSYFLSFSFLTLFDGCFLVHVEAPLIRVLIFLHVL